MTGLAMGLIYGCGVIVLMSYFTGSKRMGLATGIPALGGPVGKSPLLTLPLQSLST